MRRVLSVVFTLALVLAGCRAKEAFNKRASQNFSKDLEKGVANARYDPPKDGKLTDAQVRMYLKVRGHTKDFERRALKEAQGRSAAIEEARPKRGIFGIIYGIKAYKTFGTLNYLFRADTLAAKDLGVKTEEYDWVKAQIVAASTAASGEIDASYTRVKKSYDEATNNQTRMMYGQEMFSYERTLKAAAQTPQDDPAVAYNRQLLSKYENELNAISAEAGKL
jgi:hypothetical protein